MLWDDTELIAWMHDPAGVFVPVGGEIDAAVAAIATAATDGTILLESNKSSITGNGTDAATVTVTFRLPYPDYVVIRAGTQLVPISFTPKGVGAPFERTAQITNLVSVLTGETIVIEPYDWFATDFPGGNTLTIEVTNGV
jgi:hypothetical protein